EGPGPDVWRQNRRPHFSAIVKTVLAHAKGFVYLIVLMTLMMFLSHGTQDLYPDFLNTAHGFSASTVAYVAILYNVGAIIGAILFGQFSERRGRRLAIGAALALSLAVIPLWAFGASLLILALGAFL